MEYICRGCGWTTMNNSTSCEVCPKCGGEDFSSFFDEDNDREYNPDTEYRPGGRDW